MTHDCKLYLKPWRELTLLSDYICEDGLLYTVDYTQYSLSYKAFTGCMNEPIYLRVHDGVFTFYNRSGTEVPGLHYDAMNHICNSTKTNELEYLLNRGDKLEEHY